MKKEMTLRWRLDEAQGVINELVKEKGKEKERIKALEQENAQLKKELEAKVTDGGTEGETSSGRKRRRRTREASENATIPELPTEIWTKIAAKLTDDDALAFALTSRQLRVAQQQAGRKLRTRGNTRWKDEWGVFMSTRGEVSKDWCIWWSRRMNVVETAPECVNTVIHMLAKGGHTDVLEMYSADLPWDKRRLAMDRWTSAVATAGGHLATLQWLRSQGCAWDGWTCSRAAMNGHLEVLQWARIQGCTWTADTSSIAAEKGHLEVLQFLLDNGCPVPFYICQAAAGSGHLSVLKYLRQKGYPWEETTLCAAIGGHLEMLQWCLSNGCPFNERACRAEGKPNIVRWLDELNAIRFYINLPQ